jgi:hypothetical protein
LNLIASVNRLVEASRVLSKSNWDNSENLFRQPELVKYYKLYYPRTIGLTRTFKLRILKQNETNSYPIRSESGHAQLEQVVSRLALVDPPQNQQTNSKTCFEQARPIPAFDH